MNDWTALRSIDPDDTALLPAQRTAFVADDGHSLLDVVYDWDRAHAALGFDRNPQVFRDRLTSAFGAPGGSTEQRADFSGVWRFRELLPFWSSPSDLVTLGEGQTLLQRADALASRIGFEPQADGMRGLYLQYEGMNPSGSFKDNGMTAAFTHAKAVGAARAVCASTGNTSASLALFASAAGLQAYVLVGSGRIAFGKLSQALDYGAMTLQVDGDFDACLARVRELSIDRPELGIYLMNSLNPFRLEGQKAVMFRILAGLGWKAPDWIVCPGGNLGNCSAF
ncbi:MAG: pyridoxal-phosphate dependent enzyme, partial [Planctomycetota bacterium]